MSYIRPKEIVIHFSGYEQVDGVTSPIAVTKISFNPLTYGLNHKVFFDAVISSSRVGITTDVYLYDVTDTVIITDSNLLTNQIVPTKYRTELIVGNDSGDIRLSERVYEVRLHTNGLLETDFGYLDYAALVLTPT